MLQIKNLHVSVDGKEILKGVSLDIAPGKIIALMGPNGSGKSTLANAIMGHPKYKVTDGQILLDEEDIALLPANERAKKGLFLSFQHPVEVSGVTIPSFLRSALSAKRGEKIPVLEFKKILEEKMDMLHMDRKFMTRYVNAGFSGGEKKKAEILQLAVLEPKYVILDETDSGTDVDALRIIAEGVEAVRKGMGILLITHYDRILQYLKPDKVVVLTEGKISKEGPAELAREIEKTGYLAKESELSSTL